MHQRRGRLLHVLIEQHHAPGLGAGNETGGLGALTQEVDAPGHAAGAQGDGELRVVVVGEGVERPGLLEGLGHIGQIGRHTQRLAEFVALGDEFGKLDGIDRPGPVAQLHRSLQFGVGVLRLQRLPLPGFGVAALEQHALGPGARGFGQARQQHLARTHGFEQVAGDGVDQRVDLQGHQPRPRGDFGAERNGFERVAVGVGGQSVEPGWLDRGLHIVFDGGALALEFAGLPGVVGNDGGDDDGADDDQGDLQLSHPGILGSV